MAESATMGNMPFVWEGTDRKGNKIKGKSMAASEAAVRADLRRQGVVPSRIKKQSQGLFHRGGKITTADIAIFSRQLATMLAAGIPLVQAFEIVGNGHENAAMQKLILAIKADVEGGSSLAESLGKHPLYFDDLFVNLVESGEQAGALETLLDKIATYKEKTEAVKKKIKKALTYPAAVVVVAFVVTIILMIFVIPAFEDLFRGFGADLPAFTRLVIDVSQFIRDKGWFLAILIGAGFSTFFYFKKRSKALRHWIDRVALKIPIIGPILKKAAIARYARTLSTMFSAGVPLVEALESVAGATGNIVYEVGVLRMRDEVSTGQRLQQAMENTDLFPNMVIQMIAVGEESGSLDDMSSKVADFYEEDVDNAVDNLSSLLEPMIMAILGVLVGGLVVAMYLPIFKMGAVI
ncbi:MAG: type II secretion system F family protein [Gammaproteobacteria bacterium]|nr:type II secretion system F family protein [Gammaproteobacteria bacterium]MDH4253807.1 type II secretion system F family protein [Gammaproteobacteria bacterium]MDH5308620.1 type II secretion system F family protein [Gammaproteobacteria bacterium]